MRREKWSVLQALTTIVSAAGLVIANTQPAWSSDHFDSPAMTANPQADIGDVYAWTATEGGRLNLAMTIAGHSFSDRLQYILRIDSGKAFGRTTASIEIICRFPAPKMASCRLGTLDSVQGDAGGEKGLESRNGHFRLFAGLRDDPFYNNVKGSLAAYGVVLSAIKSGVAVPDRAGCPLLDQQTAARVADQWRHTDGGPATNLLANWTASAIVISVDLAVVSKGGPILAIRGSTSTSNKILDRMARPFVGNTLLGVSPFSNDDASGDERQAFNTADAKSSMKYVARIEKSLAFEDSLDGKCGNQLLATAASDPSKRYHALAVMFADDRLWVNSAARICQQFLAVELASLGKLSRFANDCGGRSPTYHTPNIWRSLLVSGTTDDIAWDGLRGDEHPPSATVFPFLAPPDPKGVDH